MRCKSTGCWEGINFHQFRPPLHQPWWYLPRALCWHHPSSHFCWYICFVGPLELRFDITWGQEVIVNSIPWWGIPSWDCTKRLWCSPVLSDLLQQGVCWRVYPVSFFWKPLHILWAWLYLYNCCSQNNDLFLHSRCKWCDPDFSWVSTPSLFFSPSSSPVFPRCANMSWLLTLLYWEFPWDL